MPPRTRLTKELAEKAVKLGGIGVSLDSAFVALGISKRTVEDWRQDANGKQETEAGKRYASAREEHAAKFEGHKSALLGIVYQSAQSNAKDAQWLLERLHGMMPTKKVATTTPKDNRDKPGTGRPIGATSSPDRTRTPKEPPRIRLVAND